MLHHELLLARVFACPFDDAPRLVLADALATRGDPRGELIHLQCAIAAAEAAGDEPNADLVARETELLERHSLAWLEPLGLGLHASSATFRRGFIERVAVDSETLLRTHDALFANEPVTSVLLSAVLTEAEPLRDALALPLLARLAELSFSEYGSGEPRGLAVLAERSDMRCLTSFTYRGPLRETGIAALERASFLTQLRVLWLSENQMTTSHVRQLVSSVAQRGGWPLEELGIYLDGLEDDAAEALAESTIFGGLRELWLHENALTDRAVEHLARAPWSSSLDILSLMSNRLTEGCVPFFVEGFAGLSELYLGGNAMVEADTAALRGRFEEGALDV